MNRVVVMWRSPEILDPDEARAWCTSEVDRVRAASAWKDMKFRVTAPREDEPPWYGWLLQVQVPDARSAAELLDEPELALFLADLRSLRCHPVAIVTTAPEHG